MAKFIRRLAEAAVRDVPSDAANADTPIVELSTRVIKERLIAKGLNISGKREKLEKRLAKAEAQVHIKPSDAANADSLDPRGPRVWPPGSRGDLKERLKAMGLPVWGTKEKLEARLATVAAAPPPPPPIPPPPPRLALLIDADSTPWHSLDSIIAELPKYGIITAKKAFGAFDIPNLRNYPPKMEEHDIEPVYVQLVAKRKSQVDWALMIDAMALLHTGMYDAFAIVGTDDDFTPLVERLRAADKMVVGFGRRASISKEFTNACTHFVALEDLSGWQDSKRHSCERHARNTQELEKKRRERAAGEEEQDEDGDEAAAAKKAKADADAFLRSLGAPRESE